MQLQPLMTLRADLKPPQEIGAGPYGTRMIFEVTGGHFEGDSLQGHLRTCGGDWVLIGADGFGRMDVRVTLETDDGALLYLQYHGTLEMNASVMQALQGGDATNYGDQYFMTAPRLETGDPRYTWLSQIVAVGEGRVLPGPAVEYRVYACQND